MFSGLIQSPKQDRDCTWWGKLLKNILLFLTAFRSTCYSFPSCPSQLWFSRMPQLLATSFTIRSQSTLRNGQEHFCSERGWEDWSQGVRSNLVGEIHYQHAERKIRGDLILSKISKKTIYIVISRLHFTSSPTGGRRWAWTWQSASPSQTTLWRTCPGPTWMCMTQPRCSNPSWDSRSATETSVRESAKTKRTSRASSTGERLLYWAVIGQSHLKLSSDWMIDFPG